jgi:hypothetical protein
VSNATSSLAPSPGNVASTDPSTEYPMMSTGRVSQKRCLNGTSTREVPVRRLATPPRDLRAGETGVCEKTALWRRRLGRRAFRAPELALAAVGWLRADIGYPQGTKVGHDPVASAHRSRKPAGGRPAESVPAKSGKSGAPPGTWTGEADRADRDGRDARGDGVTQQVAMRHGTTQHHPASA